jgi:hypothetical protein
VDDRVSLYVASADNFVLIGRHSPHAEHRKRKRRYFPADQGVLNFAWAEGWKQDTVTSNPVGNPAGYEAEQLRKFNVPVKVSRMMRMKCRCYKAIAINELDGVTRKAVLCFESLNRNNLSGVTPAKLASWSPLLTVILKALEPHMASLQDPIEEGY